ncbi:hypothetical protein [Actinoplanes awajinensis]|uniref:PT repeat-containing protein n=1 Tax=Actinoplanes awajinensis subsp. mycoplanecinus TaxID=135947 RepID=A0A117MNM4_9ACTN|nr:hypothetical protein [Actinoplanes awajinensis]KUL27369.1 hypothetical protein ADL15_35370 [Actinoplanes awajinensis subsp. mycoplanecinus]
MPVVKSKMARRVAACAAVAFVSVAFTAACGDKDDTSSATSGSDGQNGGGNTAFAAYTECLAKNGVTVTMPSGGPGGGGNGGTRPSGAPNGGEARPSGQPRPSGSFGGQRGGGGFGGGFQKPEGVDDATWTKAQEACASVRPSMGAGRGNGGGNGANAAFTNCLKDNGVTDTTKIDATDAVTKKAIETCKVLQPSAAASS